MAGPNVTIDMPHEFIDEFLNNNNNNDEIPMNSERLCPLCQSPIRLFYINYNEKFVMCENTECDFPFGYEELQFVKDNEDLPSDDDESPITASRTSPAPSQTCSITSNAWSEIDKIRNAYESEDTQSESIFITKEKQQHITNEEKNIMKNLNQIMKLNRQINEYEEETSREHRRIKNEKWIKKLHDLQELSGMQLLKPEEIGYAKKEQLNIGLGELKIDITPATENTMSTVNIELHNIDKKFDNNIEEMQDSRVTTEDKNNMGVHKFNSNVVEVENEVIDSIDMV